MTIQALDHFTIVTPDVEASKTFYTEILGLKDGPRPPFGIGGAWLYCGKRAVLHLIEAKKARPNPGLIDHCAFRVKGYARVKKKLDAAGISYREADVPDWPLRQIFAVDPDGGRIELVFDKAEADALPQAAE